MPPERLASYQQFIDEYEFIRQAEGRGSTEAAYYLALPFKDLTGKMKEDWRIRAISYRWLVSQVVQVLEAENSLPLHILDLGAGNGWLSNRLAQRGHHVAAVDLLTNPLDGLGCVALYQQPILALQAEYNKLPLKDGQINLAIFNASFHYSSDYRQTLVEILRVLLPTGRIVIMDTPIYHNAESGRQMVCERQELFKKVYGFPSNAIPSENYLTHARVAELGASLNLEWQVIRPSYGLQWSLKPFIARLSRRREPARFMILVGKKR